MTQTIGEVAEAVDPPMADRARDLVSKFSDNIWDFILSDSRGVYYLHTDNLVEGTSDAFRELVRSNELDLDADEAAVIMHYRESGMAAVADKIATDENLEPLLNLEGIYPRNTLTLAPHESRVRLGAITVGSISESGVTILVPISYADFLNARHAVGTLDRAIVETAEDLSSMVFKVPGLLALRTVRDFVEGDTSHIPPPSGQYL